MHCISIKEVLHYLANEWLGDNHNKDSTRLRSADKRVNELHLSCTSAWSKTIACGYTPKSCINASAS
jgi:hypothetical protein